MVVGMDLGVAAAVDVDEVEGEGVEGEMAVAGEVQVHVEEGVVGEAEAILVVVEVTTWDLEETFHRIL